jgi:hypothetical protein
LNRREALSKAREKEDNLSGGLSSK